MSAIPTRLFAELNPMAFGRERAISRRPVKERVTSANRHCRSRKVRRMVGDFLRERVTQSSVQNKLHMARIFIHVQAGDDPPLNKNIPSAALRSANVWRPLLFGKINDCHSEGLR